MKVRIEERDYIGTATEIMDALKAETPRKFTSTASYIRFVQDNLQRMTGQPCTLDGGSTELRAQSLIQRLAAIDALEVIEE